MKGESDKLLALQLDYVRRRCLGDYQTILLELSRDPAMICWLDNHENTNDLHIWLKRAGLRERATELRALAEICPAKQAENTTAILAAARDAAYLAALRAGMGDRIASARAAAWAAARASACAAIPVAARDAAGATGCSLGLDLAPTAGRR